MNPADPFAPQMMAPSRNVFGGPLEPCSLDPATGFFRNGCCDTGVQDAGSHTVCAIMTADFLRYSKDVGNDLSTPRPEYGFPGLKPGDRWCLCASRWRQAYDAGMAPDVALRSTHREVLTLIALSALKAFAIDLN